MPEAAGRSVKQLVLMQKIFFKGKVLAVFEGVYEPSEDSFLLAESFEAEKGGLVLDLGTGSGIQGINAAMLGASRVVSTDLSAKALDNAKANAESLGFGKRFEFRKGSLFSCIRPGEKFDAIIFNPPYVESEGKKFADLDGGKQGREVLDRFLEEFPKHLEKGGECFFLQTDLNGEEKTKRKLKETGLGFAVTARKKLFFEEIMVFKCFKP
jgi:release factor glutamine methyltransferase